MASMNIDDAFKQVAVHMQVAVSVCTWPSVGQGMQMRQGELTYQTVSLEPIPCAITAGAG